MTATFQLKSNRNGSCHPFIYGSLPELGGGDITKAIPLEPSTGPYFFSKTFQIEHNQEGEIVWYSYFMRPKLGSDIAEQVPKRILPNFTNNLEVYDTFDINNSIGDLVLHFRVRCFTNYGQEIYICGNIPELGEWDITKSKQMYFENNMDFWDCIVRLPLSTNNQQIEYKYVRAYDRINCEWEPEANHKLDITNINVPSVVEIADTFRWEDKTLNIYKTAPFMKSFNHRFTHVPPPSLDLSINKAGQVNVKFSMNCIHVRPGQTIRVVGSCPELGSWDYKRGIVMADGEYPLWSARISISQSHFPIHYKYVIIDGGKAIWEGGNNHYNAGIVTPGCDYDFPSALQINEWHIVPNSELFKGLGIYAPIFSLKSNSSCGIGQYTDIIKLVDVCTKVGSSLIQLLPINDTTNNGDWEDSYPYRQLSCFALHPIYIDLLDIFPNIPSEIFHLIQERKSYFESLRFIDYPSVYSFKMDILKRLFPLAILNQSFTNFIQDNQEWLKPYGLYYYFRNLYGTTDFRSWPKYSTITSEEIEQLCEEHYEEIKFVYWVQYICDNQFKKSRDYALRNGVVLKGDLPIGVFINSVECWAFPKNFRPHMSSGAPPDDYSSDGQNWSFPTYDWDYMATDNYRWWRMRLIRMAELYQVLRVDHILGFFRIWEINRDSCIRAMLGHYFPSVPISVDELKGWGLTDIERYTKPYIRWHIIEEKFGTDAKYVAEKYFIPRNVNVDDFYDFKEEYDTEKKIELTLAEIPESNRKHYRACLFQLLANVLLIEDPNDLGKYQVRTDVTCDHVIQSDNGPITFVSSSWNELPDDQKHLFVKLYQEFTYQRQNHDWVMRAKPKIEVLTKTTDILICGEDLGQLTEGILNCLRENAILSLRVQRMPKDSSLSFEDVNSYEYLSVCSPSTHDSPTLRGWWEETRSKTLDYWYNVLWRKDDCPLSCTPEISEMIIKKHLWSNSMWSIFLLQDLTGISPHLCNLQTPAEERINDPSDPNNKWKYRYPYKLEDLANDEEFTTALYDMVKASHRI